MKNRLTSFLIFTSLCCCSFAQKVSFTGKVTDSRTGEAIPYASVNCFREKLSTYTDEKGIFMVQSDFDQQLADTIAVSCIGYQTAVELVKLSNSLHIKLTPQVYSLNKVQVSARKIKKTKTINDFLPEYPDGRQTCSKTEIIALYFPYKQEYEPCHYVKTVSFLLGNGYLGGNTLLMPRKYRIRILEPDSDKQPGNDILLQNVIVSKSDIRYYGEGKEREIDVGWVAEKDLWIIEADLEKYKIPFPQNGLFIGIEWFGLSLNPLASTWKSVPGNFWLFSKGEWVYTENTHNIAISAEICN